MATSGKGSKTKGADYERKIAKKLSEWWGGTFSRVPASGGLHWGSDQRVAGDIIPPPEARFPFVIECKKREGWLIDHILLDNGQPRTWWEQVVTDARRVKLIPLLMFSKNLAKDYIMVPFEDNLYTALTMMDNDVLRTPITFENIRGETQIFDVIVTTYDTFTKLDQDYLRGYAAMVDWDAYEEDYK